MARWTSLTFVRNFFFGTVMAAALCLPAQAQNDPLPSWNDGAAKKSITDFVARTTTQGSPDFVPPAERIATFDNDGTLWSEQPFYFQGAFAFDRIRALAPMHPEWKTKQPFKGVIQNDMKAVGATGEKGLLQIVAASHAGMNVEEFQKTVSDWMATARHPRFNRPYVEVVFLPMQELLNYLRANGFKTFIVSGGGIEFMRAWVEKVYGIPPEQVVGSSGVTKFQLAKDGRPELIKEAKVEFIDDGPGKPVGINRFIGRRPVFAFGNSDGDQQMLQWTAAGPGARFMGIVHHTDAAREWAYDRKSHVGKLDKAWDEGVKRGWTSVDIEDGLEGDLFLPGAMKAGLGEDVSPVALGQLQATGNCSIRKTAASPTAGPWSVDLTDDITGFRPARWRRWPSTASIGSRSRSFATSCCG